MYTDKFNDFQHIFILNWKVALVIHPWPNVVLVIHPWPNVRQLVLSECIIYYLLNVYMTIYIVPAGDSQCNQTINIRNLKFHLSYKKKY